MATKQYREEHLTNTIIEAIIKVHKTLGPGFLEGVYHKAMLVELRKRGLKYETQKEIEIFYDDESVGTHKLDIVIERKVVLELKTVEGFAKAHYAQLRSYLKASHLFIGLLVNFAKERSDFRRIELK